MVVKFFVISSYSKIDCKTIFFYVAPACSHVSKIKPKMLKEKYDNLDLVPFSLYGPGDYELHLVELGSLTSLMTDRPTIEPSNHEGSQGSCTFKKLNNMQKN